jgi:hypothetical protein
MQSEELDYKGIKYRIVDTIGINDTKLNEEEVLDRLAKTAHSIKDGLYQILFVVKGKIDRAEKEAFELLKDSIFDNDVTKHITIVRTNFRGFRIKELCDEDLESIRDESEINVSNSSIVDSCNKLVHVDNPSLKREENDENEIKKNSERRKDSRKILLDHLETCKDTYEQEGIYRPENLYKLVVKINGLMEELEE